jgi:hypothetical protein
MNPLVVLAIIAAAVAVSVTLMLLVRRFAAPAGGFFTDSDRAAGVFGVTGTGFAVLLAFVIFLSFSSYDRAREKASVEAVAISQLFRTANLFPPDGARQLHGELICYARAVIHDEWRTMRDERESSLVDGWLARIEHTVDRTQLHGDKQRLRLRPLVRPVGGAAGGPARAAGRGRATCSPGSSGWRSSWAAG